MLMYVIMKLRVNQLTGFNVAFLHSSVTFFFHSLSNTSNTQHNPCCEYNHFFPRKGKNSYQKAYIIVFPMYVCTLTYILITIL